MHSRLDRLFLHFFDTHFIADKGRAAESSPFKEEMRLATRLAVASADRVYIPAASYFESPLCRQILGDLNELVGLGFIVLAGSATNLEEYLRERQDEEFYRKGSAQHGWYRAQHDAATLLPYIRRSRSATRDLTDHWLQSVADESLARKLRDASDGPVRDLESRIDRVPSELGNLAFIPDHVYEILGVGEEAKLVQARIRSVINEGYFESYVKDFGAGVVIDLSHLASDFTIPSYGRNLSYNRMLRFLRGRDRLKELASCDQTRLLQLGDDPEWQHALTTAVTYVSRPTPRLNGAEVQGSPNFRIAQFSIKDQISMTTSNEAGSLETVRVNESRPQSSILCVAAAHVEFAAVNEILSEDFQGGRIVSLSDGKHYAREFVDPQTGTHWYVAGLSFQGQVDAAVEVARYTQLINPRLILMVGMCMGMPKRSLAVGTVVIPNEVIAFDHQRLTDTGTEFRPHGDRVDNGPYQLARIVSASKRDYKVVADKAIASASVKIENIEADLVKTIQSAFPDAAAFDMEGWGFYRAVDGAECLWVKAVADSGEAQEANTAGRADKHAVQMKATHNALDFAIAVVREYMGVRRISSP